MHKTKLMLIVERQIGEALKDYLMREYKEKRVLARILAQRLDVNTSTIFRWLSYLEITVNYHPPKIPPESALRYQYCYKRMTIDQVAESRNVSDKRVTKWLNYYEIERRSYRDYFLNGVKVPSSEELKEQIRSMQIKDAARQFGIHPETYSNWLKRARLNIQRKSKYDSRRNRKRDLDDIIRKTGKQPEEISILDFRNQKQENGHSYRGLLYWYLSRFGFNFIEAKEHFINEFYNHS